jgi:hypothetical protein
MFHHRFAAYALPLLTAACSSADPAPPGPGQEICTIGPGPSLEAVAALGPDIAPLDGATIRVCRNGGVCAEGTFVAPADPIPFQEARGAFFPPDQDYDVEAMIWNEGSDGYVLDVRYLAERPAPTDGDAYSVTATLADGRTVVNLADTATYTHVPNCAGGYPYFRMGVPCAAKVAPPECPSDWDPVECKCPGGPK